MGIVGHHPESGLRLEMERAREGGPPWSYEGEVATPSERFRIRAVVEQSGTVSVEIEAGESAQGPASTRVAPASLVERARLIVRTAYRHARDEDPAAAPPRRIVRWRQ